MATRVVAGHQVDAVSLRDFVCILELVSNFVSSFGPKIVTFDQLGELVVAEVGHTAAFDQLVDVVATVKKFCTAAGAVTTAGAVTLAVAGVGPVALLVLVTLRIHF